MPGWPATWEVVPGPRQLLIEPRVALALSLSTPALPGRHALTFGNSRRHLTSRFGVGRRGIDRGVSRAFYAGEVGAMSHACVGMQGVETSMATSGYLSGHGTQARQSS